MATKTLPTEKLLRQSVLRVVENAKKFESEKAAKPRVLITGGFAMARFPSLGPINERWGLTTRHRSKWTRRSSSSPFTHLFLGWGIWSSTTTLSGTTTVGLAKKGIPPRSRGHDDIWKAAACYMSRKKSGKKKTLQTHTKMLKDFKIKNVVAVALKSKLGSRTTTIYIPLWEVNTPAYQHGHQNSNIRSCRTRPTLRGIAVWHLLQCKKIHYRVIWALTNGSRSHRNKKAVIFDILLSDQATCLMVNLWNLLRLENPEEHCLAMSFPKKPYTIYDSLTAIWLSCCLLTSQTDNCNSNHLTMLSQTLGPFLPSRAVSYEKVSDVHPFIPHLRDFCRKYNCTRLAKEAALETIHRQGVNQSWKASLLIGRTSSLRESDKLTDFKITCKDRQWKVHKLTLYGTRSPYFKSMNKHESPWKLCHSDLHPEQLQLIAFC